MPSRTEGASEAERDSDEYEEEGPESEASLYATDMSDDEPQMIGTISAAIRADDMSAAKALTLNLGSIADLQELLASTIKSTPGIDEVLTGPIESIEVLDLSVVEPTSRIARGRLTALEDQPDLLSKGAQLTAPGGTSTPMEKSGKATESEEGPSKGGDFQSRKDLIVGMYSQAMLNAVHRLSVEARRKPVRFSVAIMSAENVSKIKNSRFGVNTDLYCTCAVSGRPNTFGRTADVKYLFLEDLAHWEHEFEKHLCEDEALEFTLCAATGPDSKTEVLGEAFLRADMFFNLEEGCETRVELSSDGKSTGASLLLEVVSNRVEDEERERAAVKIQTIQRKRQKRCKDVDAKSKKEEKAATTIQARERGRRERQRTKQRKKEQEQAATKIQARARGRSDRKRAKQKKEEQEAWQREDEAAKKIQSSVRARKERVQQKHKEQRAAVTMQKMERGRQARNATTLTLKQRERELLEDIALIRGQENGGNKKAAWNRSAGRGAGDVLGLRDYQQDSLTAPYGTGLDWSGVGYRMPGASPSPAKKVFKVKDKKVPGAAEAGRSELEHFKAELLRREQSFAGAWRTCLDPTWQGKLAIHEFCEACRKMGYNRHLKDVWRQLDVDGNGLISLCELDWEEARDLGDFHIKLVKQFGSAEKAAKFWGMHGPRRFKMDEFFDIVISNGFARTASAADRLWRMLCCVPNGAAQCGFLGRLGNIKDATCGVTGNEFKWLESMSSELPKVTNDRVPPGEMGHLQDSTEEEGTDFLQKVKPKFDHDGFFLHMHKEGMEHHKRRTNLMDPVKPKEKQLSDPNLFARLHNDHILKEEKRQMNAAQTEKKIRAESNWSMSRSARSPEARKRILAPKKKFAEFNFDCVAKKEHLWNLLTIEQLMDECTKLAEHIRDGRTHPDGSPLEEFQLAEQICVANGHPSVIEWKSFGKTRSELLTLLDMRTPSAKSSKEESKPVPKIAQKLHKDCTQRKKELQDKQEASIQRASEDFLASLACPKHGTIFKGKECLVLATIKECVICRRFAAMSKDSETKNSTIEQGESERSVPTHLVTRRVGTKSSTIEEGDWTQSELWKDAERVVAKKIEYRETEFKKLLKEGYQSGLIAGRTVLSATIALEDCYSTHDARWEMVSGRDRERLITEAVKEYTGKHKRVQEKKQQANIRNDSSQTFFRLNSSGGQHKWETEKEMNRQQALLKDELELLSVHRDIPGNPDIYDDLYENFDRTEDVDHNPGASRRRARERSTEKLKQMEMTQQNLKSIRGAMSSPVKEAFARVGDLLEPSTDDGPRVVSFYFKEMEWKPPPRFQTQLRNRLDELGAPSIADMPCRIRRLGVGAPGVVIELRGSAETCQAICTFKGVEDLVVCEHQVSRIWGKDAVDDPLGELVEFLLLHHDSLVNAWKRISMGSNEIDKEGFMKRLRQMGYMRGLNIAYHALDNGLAKVSAESFLLLQDALVHVPDPLEKKPPSDAMKSLSKAVWASFADLSIAFDSFNIAANGQVTAAEFSAAVLRLEWSGPPETVFSELDVRSCGFLRSHEFARLGLPDVRPIVEEEEEEGTSPQKKGAGAQAKSKAKASAKSKAKAKAKAVGQDSNSRPRGGGRVGIYDGQGEGEGEGRGTTQAKNNGRAHSARPATPATPKARSAKTLEDEPESEPKHANTPNKNGPKMAQIQPSKNSAKMRPRSAPARPREQGVSKANAKSGSVKKTGAGADSETF